MSAPTRKSAVLLIRIKYSRMLDDPLSLDKTTLDAIKALETRSLQVDGGRLKLEWGSLQSRPAGERNDLLWWDGGMLVGFAGRYAFGGMTPEATGMVDPLHRGQGLGGSLLDALLALCAERGDERILLVTPRSSTAAKALAIGRGGKFHHAEHSLVLTTLGDQNSTDPAIKLRKAEMGDSTIVQELHKAGFNTDAAATILGDPADPTLVAERDGQPIATLRVESETNGARGIYGFVVDTSFQGRGIGRDLLWRVCRQALTDGAPYVHLEVEVENERALGLYTSIGFVLETTEDYYEIPVTHHI